MNHENGSPLIERQVWRVAGCKCRELHGSWQLLTPVLQFLSEHGYILASCELWGCQFLCNLSCYQADLARLYVDEAINCNRIQQGVACDLFMSEYVPSMRKSTYLNIAGSYLGRVAQGVREPAIHKYDAPKDLPPIFVHPQLVIVRAL